MTTDNSAAESSRFPSDSELSLDSAIVSDDGGNVGEYPNPEGYDPGYDGLDPDVPVEQPENKKQDSNSAEKVPVKKKGMSKAAKVFLIFFIFVALMLVWIMIANAPAKKAAAAKRHDISNFTNTDDTNKVSKPKRDELLVTNSQWDEVKKSIDDIQATVTSNRENSDAAFLAIKQYLDKHSSSIESLEANVKSLENSFHDIQESGSNNLVTTSDKFKDIYSQLKELREVTKSTSSTLSSVKKFVDEEKKVRNAPPKYEVISVVPGKARLRDVGTGHEITVGNGEKLPGYGVVDKILVTGCLLMNGNSSYEPINGRCE